jgi:fructose-specific phosphotransferase system IIC component
MVAAVVGASMWMVAGTTAMLDLETKNAVDQVLAEVPAGFLGGLLGGAVTGIVLELLGFRLEEHETA